MSSSATELIEQIRSEIIGVNPRPMKRLFEVAKSHFQINCSEIIALLHMSEYEYRMAAVCVMDFQARSAKLSATRQRELYDLYLNNHAQIDTWDMVDRAAPHVVGKFLYDGNRTPLYDLARQGSVCEKRTAIVATWYFIKKDQIDDTFALAKILAAEQTDIVAQAVGSWIREAGKRDPDRLLAFLDEHASSMHRGALRAAVEKLPKAVRQHYMAMKH